MSIEVIVFDMGHVFVDFEWEKVISGFKNISKQDDDKLKHAFRHLSKLGYEHGRIDTATFLNELNQCLATNLSLSDFESLWTHTFHENQTMAAIMSSLKKRYPLFLLSNTNELHYEFLENRYKVSRHFEKLFLSYKLGLCKPETEIYQHVLNDSGKTAESCLFIDDLEANIAAAADLGIKTIHFQGADNFQQELAAHGIHIAL